MSVSYISQRSTPGPGVLRLLRLPLLTGGWTTKGGVYAPLSKSPGPVSRGITLYHFSALLFSKVCYFCCPALAWLVRRAAGG